MIKNIIIIFLIINCILNVYSQSISCNITPIKIRHIENGKKEGNIGYKVYPENPAMPLTFIIKEGKVYVPDPVNLRLNIYDLDLNFLSMVNDVNDNYISGAERLILDDNNNFIIINHNIGLKKVSKSGEIMLHKKRYNLPEEVVYRRNIHVINNEIFIYNDNSELEILTEKGERHNKIKAINKIKVIENNISLRNLALVDGINYPENIINIIEKLKQGGKHLIIYDRFYSTNFGQHKDFYNKTEKVRKKIKEVKSANGLLGLNQKNIMDINFDGLGIKFIGYDNNHYSYWDAWTKRNSEDISKYFVLILSKYSEVIFAFYYGQLKDSNYDIQTYPTSGARIAIEPNGDVWFMVGSNKGYDFYKVERQW